MNCTMNLGNMITFATVQVEVLLSAFLVWNNEMLSVAAR